MKRIVGSLLALAVVVAAVIFYLHFRESSAKPHPGNTEAVAHILSIRLRKDTMKSLEKALGPGAPCMGGHPHGGRAWFLKNERVWVYADGFDYDRTGGRIIDDIELRLHKGDMYDFDYETPKPAIPQVNTHGRPMGWLGVVLPGMSRREVLRLTRNLPRPKSEGNTLSWKIPAVRGIRDSNWPPKVQLVFDGDRLEAIRTD